MRCLDDSARSHPISAAMPARGVALPEGNHA